MESEIEKIKSDLGNVMYEMHRVGDQDYSKLDNFFMELDRRYETIEAQKQKIRQMEEEEKQILGNASKVENTEGVVFCGQCGTQNGSTYKFCVKCGSPLA